MVQFRITPGEMYPPPIKGRGLVLVPWDGELVAQMAAWSERGFPYHPFDMGHLRDPERASEAVARAHREGPHRYFAATEDGVAVGRVCVNIRDAAGLYLWSVHVPPEHEGRGIGRRMVATLIEWLEEEYPGSEFALTANSFAGKAHSVYRSLGFTVAEIRWHYDRDISELLWKTDSERRKQVLGHIRHFAGQWQVRTYLMKRRPGTPMHIDPIRLRSAPRA